MAGYRMHRDKRMIYAWRIMSGWFVAFVLAVALVVPTPGMPAGATHHEDTSPISVSVAASDGMIGVWTDWRRRDSGIGNLATGDWGNRP
jgi:hypothetical protein